MIGPDLSSAARVYREDIVIAAGQVHDPVHHDRRCFHGSVVIMHAAVKDPGWFQLGNVGGIDLVHILVTHVARIVTVIRPVQASLVFAFLRRRNGCRRGQENTDGEKMCETKSRMIFVFG
jgi:hypothetical protein